MLNLDNFQTELENDTIGSSASYEDIKLTSRKFLQINLFTPPNVKGDKSNQSYYRDKIDTIKRSYRDKLAIIGYVHVANGLGKISDVACGYWIIAYYKSKLVKFLLAYDADEFQQIIEDVMEWKSAPQLFI